MMSTDNVMVADLEVMAHANNYRNWMYRQVEPYLGQRILEVGAGIGNFTEMLMDRELVVATDKFEKCVNYLKARLGHHLECMPMQLDLANPSGELERYDFDTVICLNVLEHVEDDLSALSYMYSVLQPRGRLVLLVPAFQFLYGSVDRAIEHHRRYTKRDLLPKMRQSGFQIEDAFYMNVVGMAGWFWNNRIRKIQEENLNQIGFFDRFIAPWAERIERFAPPPFGLSLIAIGNKRAAGSR
jgi:2-polyprenyl-3-methyl-5-hydroxy-6-metoxy-1,4-benzoquinol methylase